MEKEEKEIIELTGAKPGLGCEPPTLVNAAIELGLAAEYVPTSSLDEVSERMQKGEMIIVDWFSPEVNGHYSVVVEVTEDTITLANPTHGDHTVMTHEDFLNHWFELDAYPPQDPSKFFLREIVSVWKTQQRTNKFTQSIIIDKPTAEVFTFAVDPKNTPKWVTAVVQEEANESPSRLGTIYRNQDSDGHWTEFEVTNFVDGEIFEMKKIDDTHYVKYTFTPNGSGTTLEYCVWVESGQISPRFSQENIKRILDEFKVTVESQ